MTSHQSVPPGERPTGAPDAGLLDAGPLDAGPPNAGPLDAGLANAGPLDAGLANAGPEREPLLRPAMFQDDDDPAWAWWLPLPGLAVAIVWAAYQAVSADSDSGGTFLRQLAWPGAAALVLTTIAAYFGWRLDLD